MRVPVYSGYFSDVGNAMYGYVDPSSEIVAHVEYNDNLDVWDGHNWGSGNGIHLGLTRLRKSGEFVLIHGTQWDGERDVAYVISDKDAAQLVAARNPGLFAKYPMLRELLDDDDDQN